MWCLVLVIRTFGLMEYESVSTLTIVVICFYIVFFTIGFGISKRVLFKTQPGIRFKKYVESPKKGMKLLVVLSVVLSIICVVSMFIKVKNQSVYYGVSLSLQGLTRLRGETLGDRSYELGSSMYGMIASMLFGFPVLCGVLAIVHRHNLTRRWKQSLWFSFIMGLIASMLTGGRFMAFTFALFYYFSSKIVPGKSSTVTREVIFQRVIIVVASLVLFWVFSQMFLNRMGIRSISAVIYFLPLCEPKNYTTLLISALPSLDTFIGLLAYFEYYVAHGVSQLDILLNAPFPTSAPYWGGYEFSTFFLFFGKIGLPVITTETILAEIVNPGVYFTHIGALFLNFGYWISLLLVLSFGYLSGYAWPKFHSGGIKLSLVYLNVIILSLVSFAPIVSLISAGYFPAIIVSYFLLVVFESFVALPLFMPELVYSEEPIDLEPIVDVDLFLSSEN